MSTDPLRHALSGATMGTRWSALLYAGPDLDPAPLQAALQAAVDEVDAQMSTWRASSDLMWLNAAPVGEWLALPERLAVVIGLGLAIGRASDGAFDIGVGDAVGAWGFGPEEADPGRIRAALRPGRAPAHLLIDLDPAAGKLRKLAPVAVDLNGIAKGYGVDRLAEILRECGVTSGLVAIDGELRALGHRPDGEAWTVAVEAPDRTRRAPHSILALEDAAVATSGDYRHWVDVGGRRLSHTMDPRKGGPLAASPASVTVVAPTCAEADGWATALMVLGVTDGAELARQIGLNALFLTRTAGGAVESTGVGPLFEEPDASDLPA